MQGIYNILTLLPLSPEKSPPILPCSLPISYRVPKHVPIETSVGIPALVHPRSTNGYLDRLEVTIRAIHFNCLAKDQFMTKAPTAIRTPYARL